jgi:hypothetical protein
LADVALFPIADVNDDPATFDDDKPNNDEVFFCDGVEVIEVLSIEDVIKFKSESLLSLLVSSLTSQRFHSLSRNVEKISIFLSIFSHTINI